AARTAAATGGTPLATPVRPARSRSVALVVQRRRPGTLAGAARPLARQPVPGPPGTPVVLRPGRGVCGGSQRPGELAGATGPVCRPAAGDGVGGRRRPPGALGCLALAAILAAAPREPGARHGGTPITPDEAGSWRWRFSVGGTERSENDHAR